MPSLRACTLPAAGIWVLGMVGHGLATPEATVRSNLARAIFIGALTRVLEIAQEWLHRRRSMRGRPRVFEDVLGRNRCLLFDVHASPYGSCSSEVVSGAAGHRDAPYDRVPMCDYPRRLTLSHPSRIITLAYPRSRLTLACGRLWICGFFERRVVARAAAAAAARAACRR